MKTQIFRKEALERMGSPEQLDRLMTVTSLRGWVALAAVGLVLAATLLWSILGEIPTTLKGQGILVRLGGVKDVPAPFSGTVESVCVQVGDMVEEGRELARLLRPGVDGPDSTVVGVHSPKAGRILNIDVFEGDSVQEQSILLRIERIECPLQAVVYVPANDGYRVQVNDPVRIEPATAETRSARRLLGAVSRAGRWTATQNHMLYNLRNPGWTSILFAQGPMLEITVEFPVEQDPEKPERPSDSYFDGTPCQAWITVDTQRPIEFVLPFLEDR